jgi:hypothetical protein
VAPDAPRPSGQSGYTWGAADIKVCAGTGAGTKKGIEVGPDTWALVYDDASLATPSNVIYSQFPRPEYPFSRVLNWGQCVRGWVTFVVPVSKHPKTVEYQPSTGDVVDWAVA